MIRTYRSGGTTINLIDPGNVDDRSRLPFVDAAPAIAPQATPRLDASAAIRSHPVESVHTAHGAAHPPRTITRENPLGAALIAVLTTAVILGMIALFTRGMPVSFAAMDTGSCRMVSITRADTERATSMSVRFRTEDGTGAIAGLDECIARNRGTVVEREADLTGGTKVRMRLESGVARIALPSTYREGTADQVVCSRTVGGTSHRKYAVSWRSSLPSTIRLDRLDSYDRATADAICSAMLS